MQLQTGVMSGAECQCCVSTGMNAAYKPNKLDKKSNHNKISRWPLTLKYCQCCILNGRETPVEKIWCNDMKKWDIQRESQFLFTVSTQVRRIKLFFVHIQWQLNGCHWMFVLWITDIKRCQIEGRGLWTLEAARGRWGPQDNFRDAKTAKYNLFFKHYSSRQEWKQKCLTWWGFIWPNWDCLTFR